MTAAPKAIPQPYPLTRRTWPVYTGVVELGSRRESFGAQIELIWRPRPEFRLSASPLRMDARVALGRQPVRIPVLGRTRLLHVLLDRVEYGSAEVTGGLEPARFSRRRLMHGLRFIVPNFPSLQPASAIARGNHVWAGRVEVAGGAWELTLDSRPGDNQTYVAATP